MHELHNSDADCVARARSLITRAALGVEQLEKVAGQAFCRLTALMGMLARLEDLAQSCDPEDVEAALLDTATVCREAEILLRYLLDARQWESVRVAVNGGDRPRSPAWLSGSLATGG
jgi:hypothetical protein